MKKSKKQKRRKIGYVLSSRSVDARAYDAAKAWPDIVWWLLKNGVKL